MPGCLPTVRSLGYWIHLDSGVFYQTVHFCCVFMPPSIFSSKEVAVPSTMNRHADVSARLTSLTLPGKAESVVSLTSQCSYSSTIVHVGDKKPQPELGTPIAPG